jgi:hypothetical protein
MYKKVLLCTVGLAAAAGGPIAYFSAWDYWKLVRAAIASPRAAETKPSADDPSAAPDREQPAYAVAKPLLEGAPLNDLAEVLRFDVTPGWVMQRWPRVSAGLANLQLKGYRVPLVTGTKPSDLAGALTYYFNPQQQVQQITFRGTTGDVSNLVQLLTTRYNFTRRLANDPGLIVYETVNADRRQVGLARIRAAWVVRSTDPYRKFEVELVMERPT